LPTGADAAARLLRRRPLAHVEEAKDALTRLAAGKEVELRYGGTKTDRHGLRLRRSSSWMARSGCGFSGSWWVRGSRVYSFPDNRACVKELLASEAEARGKRLGVWRSPAYRVESADDVDGLDCLTQTYQLVEGKVLSVGEGAGRIYLNFARDWKSDFTISVARKDVSVFDTRGIDLKKLAGRRVRGWLIWRNGPMIEATHPQQIEVIPDDPKRERAKPQLRQESRPGDAL
jgi:micrococcal nuclease